MNSWNGTPTTHSIDLKLTQIPTTRLRTQGKTIQRAKNILQTLHAHYGQIYPFPFLWLQY